ncbi:Copper chaperone for superoxide dismutase /cytosolic [Citrus sinensis]|uniref:Copper chaperone for superoxide dismutase /cytosolic n=1 Tax=Citrus sinensis TaxID=2711 RepID=A0ACB8LWD0_CITSI|nr:Copper chaperone for superoxide dismutase /cytosolic [Citrus sinensis]
MAILRTVATLATATTTTAVAAFAFSSSSSFTSKSHQPKSQNLSFFSSQSLSLLYSNKSPLVKNFSNPPSALPMDAPTSDHKNTSQGDQGLPELLTEYMVDMKCEGCVDAVKQKLQTVTGVKNVEVDLSNQVVRILGSSPLKTMTEALEQTGRKARLVGQGVPEDFLVSAAVAEFKGPDVFGVVRLAQVNMELARIEANFSGLSPGKHGWSINEFGDLTKGAVSTGRVYNPKIEGSAKEPLGDLGTVVADEKGEAFFSGVKEMLRVADLIGRSIVVYGTEDKSDSGVTAAVIARSAGVGENYKKICACDGTIIWESSSNDFVASKV